MGWLTRASAVVAVATLVASGIWYGTSGASPKPHHRKPHHSQSVASTPCSSTAYTLTVSVTTTGGTTTTVPVSGQVSFTSAAGSAAITLPSSFPYAALAGATEQIDFVGNTLYLAVPPSLSSFVGGASWASLQLPSGLDHAVATLGADLAGWCGDAGSLVVGLQSKGGIATAEGPSAIGGVPVDETQVTIGTDSLTSLLKVIRPLDSKIASQADNASVTFDIWAGRSSNQLVQLSAAVTGLDSQLGLSAVSLMLDLTDIDQPVTITAPAGAVPLSKSMVKTVTRMLESVLS